jgi:hypothetical protein
MAVKTEGKYSSDVVKFEQDRNFGREVLTEATGQDLAIGDIYRLATGEATIITNGEAANARGVVVAVDAKGNKVGLCRGPAVVIEDNLNYNSSTASTVNTALLARNILVTPSVHDE